VLGWVRLNHQHFKASRKIRLLVYFLRVLDLLFYTTSVIRKSGTQNVTVYMKPKTQGSEVVYACFFPSKSCHFRTTKGRLFARYLQRLTVHDAKPPVHPFLGSDSYPPESSLMCHGLRAG
jgi:hypothetical protein